MRYLGIDYGTKRVGIAFSDEDGAFAFPETVLPNDEALLPRVWELAKEHGIGEVVIGASYDYERKANPLMKDILRFKGNIEKEFGLTVHLIDETLSSGEARRVPQNADAPRSREQRSSAPVDASAAAIILQHFLDTQHHGK